VGTIPWRSPRTSPGWGGFAYVARGIDASGYLFTAAM